MAYLTCNESFQDLKERLKNFKGRAGKSSLLQKLKASLKDPKVRKGLGLGAGYLALGKLYHMKQKDAFDKKAKIKVAQAKWTRNGNSDTYEEKIQNLDSKGNPIANSSTTITHTAPSYTDILLNPLLNRYNFKDNVKHESAILVPGTFVYNEGIIDTVKDKVSGAVDGVGNAINSVKERVKTNVGNLANGINYGINSAKNVARGIANGISGAQEKIANFASNVVGSKNVKPANESFGLLQLPYEDEYYYDEEDINEGFLGFGKKKSRWQRFKDAIKRNKGKIAAGALGLGTAAWTGRSRYNYNKALSNARDVMKKKEAEGWHDDTENQRFWKYKDNDKNQAIVSTNYGWNPFKGYGNQKLGLKFIDTSKIPDEK